VFPQNHYPQEEMPGIRPSEGLPSLSSTTRAVCLLMIMFVRYARLLCPLVPALMIALIRGYGFSGGRFFDLTWTHLDVNLLYAFSFSWEVTIVGAVYCLSLALANRKKGQAILSGVVFAVLVVASVISAAAVRWHNIDVFLLVICHVCEIAPALLLVSRTRDHEAPGTPGEQKLYAHS